MSLVVVVLATLGGVITASYVPEMWWAGTTACAGLGLIVALISWHKGPEIVLRISDSRRATERELRLVENLTEEMALAAGIPTPHAYIIDDPSPNAFATGKGPRHGVVVVTSGLLERLDRDELQAVIAHEVAHVRNNDIRLMTTLAIVAGLVPMISEFYLRVVFRGGRGRKGEGAIVFVVIAIVFAILAPIFTKLLELAVSRRREFLADATASQLTRNPEALASALEKLSSSPVRLESANHAIEHLFIVNPFRPRGKDGWSLFSTHPPVSDRIAALRGTAGVRRRRLPDDFSDMPPIPDQTRR